MKSNKGSVVALCGGVGGAKLALGLSSIVEADKLTIVVNTADDFDHLGLRICPDLDTVLYTLGGVADRVRGWGLANETWHFMDALAHLGGEQWFQLGDRDLATHIERSHRLASGERLSEITNDFAKKMGVSASIVPMTDDRVATFVDTDEGMLAFQDYFVAKRSAPRLKRIEFRGGESAKPTAAFEAALEANDLAAVIICPSNPWLSINPILSLPGIRHRLQSLNAPVVAVSPIIAGRAIKGPTDKIMTELGLAVSNNTIAQQYSGLIQGILVDSQDKADGDGVASHLKIASTNTLMRSLEDRVQVARSALALAELVERSA